MATFTIDFTIAGTVNGRSVNYTHSTTLTGIEEVVRDNDVAGVGLENISGLYQTGSNYYRGRTDFTGATFAMINNTSIRALMRVTDAAETVSFQVPPGVPMLYWHSFDYDAALGYDAATPASPDSDLTGLGFEGVTGPTTYEAIGLFRAIT